MRALLGHYTADRCITCIRCVISQKNAYLEFASPKNLDFYLVRHAQANFRLNLAFILLSQSPFSEPYGDDSLVLTADVYLLSWLRMGGAVPLRGSCV